MLLRLGSQLTFVLAITCAAPMLHAGVVFQFANGTQAARATFTQSGNSLFVTLDNTSTFDVRAPEDVLTGLFFNIHGLGADSLTPQRATLGVGSIVAFPKSGDGTDANGEIGGEYGFRSDLFVGRSGATMAISGVGLGDLIGPPHLFPGENLSGPRSGSPAGIGYGLLSSGDDLDSGNRPVTGKSPLIYGQVIFELAGLPEDFVLDANVADVLFNYGSDLNPVPEPTTLVLTTIGMVLVARRRRR